jgi:hypothetical protein
MTQFLRWSCASWACNNAKQNKVASVSLVLPTSSQLVYKWSCILQALLAQTLVTKDHVAYTKPFVQ